MAIDISTEEISEECKVNDIELILARTPPEWKSEWLRCRRWGSIGSAWEVGTLGSSRFSGPKCSVTGVLV